MSWWTDIDLRRQRFCGSALFRSGFLPIVSLRFRLCLGQDSLLVAGGSTSRYSCFLSEKWAAIQTVRWESESHSGEEVEVLQRKFSVEIVILFGQTGRSLKIVNPYFKRQGALLILDFAPERSPQTRGADLRSVV